MTMKRAMGRAMGACPASEDPYARNGSPDAHCYAPCDDLCPFLYPTLCSDLRSLLRAYLRARL